MKFHSQRGVTHVEVLVAITLIALMLVPAMQALQPGLQGSGQHKTQAEIQFALQDKIEEVLAKPFAELNTAATTAGSHTTPTSYSDGSDAEYQRNVFIWPYDIDNADTDNNVFTDGEANLLWVRVVLLNSNHAIETLISNY